MTVKLVLVFIASLLDEAIVVAIVIWGLPLLGITIPLPGLVILFVVLSVYAVISYRLVMRALTKKPVIGLPNMVGSRGKVVSPLAPKGTIRIRGELWQAVSASGTVDAGGEIIVVSQDGLELIVRKPDFDDRCRQLNLNR